MLTCLWNRAGTTCNLCPSGMRGCSADAVTILGFCFTSLTAGFTCPSYGTYTPSICPSGTYRSQADSITCRFVCFARFLVLAFECGHACLNRLCPQATFNSDTGAPDIAFCTPCPAGRVCGLDGMTNLDQSLACPDGHVCADATASAGQFNHKCPGGYVCNQQTIPDQQYVPS